MTGQEITLGGALLSVLLSVVLRMIYGTWEIQKRFKSWIAVGIGIGLSIVAMLISVPACTGLIVATYVVQGFMTGATATGIYEMTKSQK